MRSTEAANRAPPPSPRSPPPVPPAEPEERRKNPLALIAIIILVIAVGVGSYLLWPKGDGNTPSNNNAGTGSTNPPANQSQTQSQSPTATPSQPQSNPQTNPPSDTTPSNTSQNQTPPNQTGQPPAAPQSAQQALTAYYALIPGDLQTGFATLTDNFKAVRGLTFPKYQTWWSQYSGVQLSDFAPQGDNVVSVTVTYLKGGSVSSTERHDIHPGAAER